MKLFLLVYDRRSGLLRSTREFSAASRTEALRARFQAESDYDGQDDIEVVLLGAASLGDLKTTHSRYFMRVDELPHHGVR